MKYHVTFVAGADIEDAARLVLLVCGSYTRGVYAYGTNPVEVLVDQDSVDVAKVIQDLGQLRCVGKVVEVAPKSQTISL